MASMPAIATSLRKVIIKFKTNQSVQSNREAKLCHGQMIKKTWKKLVNAVSLLSTSRVISTS